MPNTNDGNAVPNNAIEELCGWMPHPDHVAAILAKLDAPHLAQAAPHLVHSWDGKSNVKLWDAVIKVTGKNLPAHKQGIGDCVSHGHGGCLDVLECVQIVAGDDPDGRKEFDFDQDCVYTEAMYGMMRQRANQLSTTDGAAGIWAVDSLVNDGFARRKGRQYNAQDAKKWGAEGLPVEIKDELKKDVTKLAQYVQVKTTRDAIDLLNSGYPISVCSNQGFELIRDNQGVCKPKGIWGHCMFSIGGILLSGLLHFCIVQSWGQNIPSGPTIENMPDNSFLIEESIFQRMLNANDSYGLSGIPGLPRRELNFFV